MQLSVISALFYIRVSRELGSNPALPATTRCKTWGKLGLDCFSFEIKRKFFTCKYVF